MYGFLLVFSLGPLWKVCVSHCCQVSAKTEVLWVASSLSVHSQHTYSDILQLTHVCAYNHKVLLYYEEVPGYLMASYLKELLSFRVSYSFYKKMNDINCLPFLLWQVVDRRLAGVLKHKYNMRSEKWTPFKISMCYRENFKKMFKNAP